MPEMPTRAYHDFVLFTDVERDSFDEHGTLIRFSVRVFQSPVGEGTQKDPVELDLAGLEAQTRALAARLLSLDDQMQLGRELARLLFPDYASELFQRSLAWAGQRGDAIRLRLRLIPQLANLPWEFLFLQAAGGDPTPSSFLALDRRVSIVRHEAIAIAPEWSPPAARHRLVVAMASPEGDGLEPLVNLLAEQRAIKQVLEARRDGIDSLFIPDYGDGVGWEQVCGARLEDVQTAFQGQRADIFHFSGHGDFAIRGVGRLPDTVEGAGQLALAGPHNRVAWIPGDRLASVIRERGVRLVTLGACRTGERDRLNAWSSVAASLLENRIPSVVAMQFTVHDDMAAAFMAAFYDVLVRGRMIDEAVAEGRLAMLAKAYGDRAEDRDWGAPVLYSRVPTGFILPPVADAVTREEAQRNSENRYYTYEAWWRLMAEEGASDRSSLRTLAARNETLVLSPIQALILLRSAVERDEEVRPWLDRLRGDEALPLRVLDEPGGSQPAIKPPPAVKKALGLDDSTLSDRPEGVSRVAWSAVSHPNPFTRRTAALALSTLEPAPEEALRRLEGALAHTERRIQPRRRAELWGTMADTYPQVERLDAGLPFRDRLGVWWWRARRRIGRDRPRMGSLTLGGGIGGAVALGLLRAAIALVIPGVNPTIQAAMYSYWGFFTGAVTVAGMTLAGPLLVPPLCGTEAASGDREGRKQTLLAVGLGALCAGIGLLLLSLAMGLSLLRAPLVPPLGFLFGVGLSLALTGLPLTRRPRRRIPLFWRALVAAAGGLLIQVLFDLAGDKGLGITISWPHTFYRANLSGFVETQWPTLAERIPYWPYALGLADAALVGAALAVGIARGLNAAAKVQTFFSKAVTWLAPEDQPAEAEEEARNGET